MNQSEQIDQLMLSLNKAQADISDPVKNKTNPAFKNKYADLGQVWDVVKPINKEHGLVLVVLPSEPADGDGVSIDYLLGHVSGQFLTGKFSGPIGKRDMQGVGGGITYGTRYILNSLYGLAADDDDGNSAVAKAKPAAPVKPMATTAQIVAYTKLWVEKYGADKAMPNGMGEWTEERIKSEYTALKAVVPT